MPKAIALAVRRATRDFKEFAVWRGETTNEGVPGAAYSDGVIYLSAKHTVIDFSDIIVRRMRIIVTASGNEAGAGKGVEIYDFTNTVQLCEVTWDGVALQYELTGAWVTANLPTGEIELGTRIKGSSGTETVKLYIVSFQFEYEGKVLI